MKKTKTLLITYYWPPSSGAGVMRWFKMGKYWGKNGGDLTIFTPDAQDFPAYDKSLVDQLPSDLKVIKTPIWEPYNLYKRFTGKKGNVYSGFLEEKKPSWKGKLAIWIRSNFFIPDARMFWIKPSIKFLTKYVVENKIDVIITTGPPHSMHMIGLGLKEKLGIKWIADFRDPWTDIDYADQLRLTSWARKKHHRLEKKVLQFADKVVTVSWSWKSLFENISGRSDIEVITNGYDPDDFENLKREPSNKFTICHLGSLAYNRNPDLLWPILKELKEEINGFSEALEIKLIGQVDAKIIQEISDNGLDRQLVKLDFMPHREGLQHLINSSLLLLPISKFNKSAGMIPGKTYEYLASGRPILALGPEDSDVRKVLLNNKSTVFFNYNDKRKIHKSILESFNSSQIKENTNLVNLMYSRKYLAEKYINLIKKQT